MILFPHCNPIPAALYTSLILSSLRFSSLCSPCGNSIKTETRVYPFNISYKITIMVDNIPIKAIIFAFSPPQEID
jgi:hypothetical protein